MGVCHKNCSVYVNNEDIKEHLNAIRIFIEGFLKLKVPKCENIEIKSSSNENSNNN